MNPAAWKVAAWAAGVTGASTFCSASPAGLAAGCVVTATVVGGGVPGPEVRVELRNFGARGRILRGPPLCIGFAGRNAAGASGWLACAGVTTAAARRFRGEENGALLPLDALRGCAGTAPCRSAGIFVRLAGGITRLASLRGLLGADLETIGNDGLALEAFFNSFNPDEIEASDFLDAEELLRLWGFRILRRGPRLGEAARFPGGFAFRGLLCVVAFRLRGIDDLGIEH